MPSLPHESSLHEDRLDALIDAWLEAAERGVAPEPEEYIGRDPEFALGLQAFFANHGKMQGLARDFSPSGRPIRDSDEGLAAAASVLLSDTIPSEDVPTLEPTQIGSTAETPGLAGTGSHQFSDHLLLDEIAHGGMGVVFRGRD